MRTRTTIAVTESKLSIRSLDLNDTKIPVCRNAVTIQTKHHVIVRFPCSRCHDILCQVVISFRCSFQFCFAAYGLPLCHNAMVILICACRAADGMVNMLTFRHRHRNRHRCIQHFRNGMKPCHIQLFTLFLGQFRHSLVDSFQLCTDTFCIFHRHCLRQSVDECLYLLHCCLLLIICPGVLRAGITIADTFIGGFARSGIFRAGSFHSGALIGRSLCLRCRRCFCFLLLFRRVCFLFCHRISLLCDCCHG